MKLLRKAIITKHNFHEESLAVRRREKEQTSKKQTAYMYGIYFFNFFSTKNRKKDMSNVCFNFRSVFYCFDFFSAEYRTEK